MGGLKRDPSRRREGGTFVKAIPSITTARRAYGWAYQNGVPNIVPEQEMHCTLFHSGVGYDIQGRDYAPAIIIPREELKLYTVRRAGRKRLFLGLHSEKVYNRIKRFEERTGESCLRAGEIPHITLSQDIRDWDGMEATPINFDVWLWKEAVESSGWREHRINL
jgi:hypothetical protein